MSGKPNSARAAKLCRVSSLMLASASACDRPWLTQPAMSTRSGVALGDVGPVQRPDKWRLLVSWLDQVVLYGKSPFS